MKVLIVYESIHHGNTKKVLDAIAKELRKKCKVQMIKPSKASGSLIKKSGLIIFGSGIYASKHHASLLRLVDKLSENKGKKAVIVSTSGFSLKSFHNALRKKLVNKGFKVIAEFNCKGWDTFGPFKLIGGINKGRPSNKDLEEAEKFIRKIA